VLWIWDRGGLHTVSAGFVIVFSMGVERREVDGRGHG